MQGGLQLAVEGLELLARLGEALAGQEEVGQPQVEVAAQDAERAALLERRIGSGDHLAVGLGGRGGDLAERAAVDGWRACMEMLQ